MQNIKEDIQNEIRKVLFAYPIKSEIVDEVCEVVERNFQNYPSPKISEIHPDTKDNNRYNNADVDVDMLNQMYNQTI